MRQEWNYEDSTPVFLIVSQKWPASISTSIFHLNSCIVFILHGGEHEKETCKSALSGSNGGIRNLRMRKQCSRDRKDRDNCSGSDKRSGRNNSSRGRGRHRENETDEVVIGNPRDAVQAQVITLLKELQEKNGLKLPVYFP